MNPLLKKLSLLSEKESRLIIGLMSGTSLDGLDIALCRLKGWGLHTKAEVLQFETYPYTDLFKNAIRSIFSVKTVDLEKLTLLNAQIAFVHADFIMKALNKWKIEPDSIDCIASHGQTIYHAPKRLHGLKDFPDATLQIGDADHIALKTGIITLSDFRQKHIAAGGEGAPLALYGDCILFRDMTENRVLLNIGGISNFSYLPSNQHENVISTDAGPGNTIIDRLCLQYYNLPFDEDGKIARTGKINATLLNELLNHSFFKHPFPKSTGPELFNMHYLEDAINRSGQSYTTPEDLIATATAFTAHAIALGIKMVAKGTTVSIYSSGGGSHNEYLIEQIIELLPEANIKKSSAVGVNPDAKEALLFALLANETLCGSAIATGSGPSIMMGKISLPS